MNKNKYFNNGLQTDWDRVRAVELFIDKLYSRKGGMMPVEEVIEELEDIVENKNEHF